jgi:uncharacterized protein YpmS
MHEKNSLWDWLAQVLLGLFMLLVLGVISRVECRRNDRQHGRAFPRKRRGAP